MKYSIFKEPPEGFQPNIEVASCYCQWKDKLLFLKRHPEKPQGGTWGVPAGKLEKNETPREAVIRETQEEVGIFIDDENLKIIGKLYCRLPHVDYIYHMFHQSFQTLPTIALNLKEHLEMKWVTIEEAFALPLITGAKEALIYYRQNSEV